MKTKTIAYITAAVMTLYAIFPASGSARKEVLQYDVELSAKELQEKACAISPYIGDDPWHITNLYNCSSKELFIPYQLWTGASWDGDKNADCIHSVNTESILSKPINATGRYSKGKVIIKGITKWTHPESGEELEVFERHRPHRNAVSYYECHKRGIGKVHNLRKPKGRWVRGLCHIPAGEGWVIGQQRTCIKTTLEIVNVSLDNDMRLKDVTVKYWYRDKLKYRYTYEREKGTVEVLSYKKKKKA